MADRHDGISRDEGTTIGQSTWGPSNSEDTDDDSINCKEANASTWSSFVTGIFSCGTADLAFDEIDDLDLSLEEDPFFGPGGGCYPVPAPPQTTTKKSRSKDKPKPGNSVSSDSLVEAKKPASRAWSSPARLHHAAMPEDFEQLYNDQNAKVLDDVFYFSDMDTFLSDDFTDMEQGFFNHLYDQICKPVNLQRRPGLGATKGGQVAHNEVLVSFDDTISKLTLEDGQKSISTVSLNTLEKVKKSGADEATIAAIVKAQAIGGWRGGMAQEEAEARAEELSRFGIEHTFTESENVREPPSDNIIVVHHRFEANFEDSEPVTSESSINTVDRLRQEECEDARPPRPKKKGFLKRAFKRSILKIKTGKDGKETKQKRNWGLLTPTRKTKQQTLHAPSPTISTAPCSSVSADSDKARSTNDSEIQVPSITRENSPSVFDKVEVSPTRKEPVSNFIRIQSGNRIVQDVELTREGSDISNSNPGSLNFGSVNPDGFDEDDVVPSNEGPGDFPPWILSPGKEKERRLDVPDLHDLEDDECSSFSSMEPMSIATMTSRLTKEREETERLRQMLEEKDEDLEKLRELLQANSSEAVIRRINDMPNLKAIPQF